MDSSVVGYDGARNVRDEGRPVGRKKLVRKAEPPSKRGIAWPRWTGFRGMTLRSWLELLVVPLALVVIGFLFSVQQDARQQRIEDQRAEAEQELAEQRAQDEALQAYLDQMGSLLLEKDLRSSSKDDEVRILARARTLTVLRRLGPDEKGTVVQFLYEAGLIKGPSPVITLFGADLRSAELPPAKLPGANFNGADLSLADLSLADLHSAYLDADLPAATLRGTNLSSANLRGASLYNADLSFANLYNAKGWTNEQLKAARSLKGAIMPNGQKYEDWLKSKD